MVSIAQTAKKYRGRKAETYDEVRQKQERWRIENETVERMLRVLRPRSVLDVPVGTGRFLDLYHELNVRSVKGIDVSGEMLALAARKIKPGSRVVLHLGHAEDTGMQDATFDAVVCVRFLDLIDEDAMRAVVREICRVARVAVILTIRFGSKYVPKANTAEHDRRRFMALIKGLGWKVDHVVPFRDAGWEILKLTRRE